MEKAKPREGEFTVWARMGRMELIKKVREVCVDKDLKSSLLCIVSPKVLHIACQKTEVWGCQLGQGRSNRAICEYGNKHS